MRKVLFTGLLLLCMQALPAQTFRSRVVDDPGFNKSYMKDMGVFRDSLLLVAGTVSMASCPYSELFAYDMQGEEVWRAHGSFDVICTGKDHIYTAGYVGTGDVLGYDQILISGYDRQGQETFSLGYPGVPHGDTLYDFKPKSIAVAEDGTIIVASETAAIKTDTGGSRIKDYRLPLTSPVTGILAVDPVTYLISTNTGIYRSDSSFTLQDSLIFSDTLRQVLLMNDTAYLLFSPAVIRLDTGLTILDTLIAGSPDRLLNMHFYGEDLWIRNDDPDSIALLRIRGGAITDNLIFPLNEEVMDFAVTGSSYIFTGNTYTGQIGLYACPRPQVPGFTLTLPDIELADFYIDSITGEYRDNGTFKGYHFTTHITVKNNGPDTLRSFAVFSILHGGMFCAQNFFYQKITGLKVPPGEAVTVKLKRAFEEGLNNRLCFECLAPNSVQETEAKNNFLCKSFEIIGVRDIRTVKPRVYPNPARGYIFIESPEQEIGSIVLTDITGKVILTKYAVHRHKYRLDLSGLAPGVYLLTTGPQGKSATQIIVKSQDVYIR